MSRAFTKELDGWNFCRSRQRDCSDATFSGRCELSECKFREEAPQAPADTNPKKETENTK